MHWGDGLSRVGFFVGTRFCASAGRPDAGNIRTDRQKPVPTDGVMMRSGQKTYRVRGRWRDGASCYPALAGAGQGGRVIHPPTSVRDR